MTDQEGGQVRRLPGAPALSEKQIGASSDPVAAATSAGTGAGQNLAGVGMNVNLTLQRRGQPHHRTASRAVLTG